MPNASKAKTKSGLNNTVKAVAIGLAIVFLSFSAYRLLNRPSGLPTMVIDSIEIEVEVVSEFVDRQKGLSDRISMPAEQGMLFVFEESDFHGFWMKDMNFSIDMIWIDASSHIIHIEHSVSPNTYPEIYRPIVPAKYVLEVNAEYADSNGIEIGDTITFNSGIIN